MNNKNRLITLVCCSLIWFVFGTIILLRASKDVESIDKYTGNVEEIGTAKSTGPKRTIDVLYFKLAGLKQTLGIYHNSIKDYDKYLDELKSGDQVSVLFDGDGMTTREDFNLHVYQFEKNGVVLLSKKQLDATNKKVSFALYLTGLLFFLPALWFYNKRIKNAR